MPSVMEHDLEVLSLNQTFPLQTCSFFLLSSCLLDMKGIYFSQLGRMISNVPASLVIIYIHIGVP